MKWWILGLTGVMVLGGIWFVQQAKADPIEPKQVELNYNGYMETITTTAPDVSTFLLTELGDYSGWVVSPDPETKLAAGDTVTIRDAKPLALNQTVATNFKIATTPPPPPPPKPKPLDKPKSKVYSGLATWYRHGTGLNTASRDFPKGTKLRVVAVKSGKSVDVVVSDYGPQPSTGNSLDLNTDAFSELAPLGAGKIEVKYFKL